MDTTLLQVSLSLRINKPVCPLGIQLSVYLPKGSFVLTNVGRTLPDQASPRGDSDNVSLSSRGLTLKAGRWGAGRPTRKKGGTCLRTAEPFVGELSLMTAGFNQIVLGVGVVIRLIVARCLFGLWDSLPRRATGRLPRRGMPSWSFLPLLPLLEAEEQLARGLRREEGLGFWPQRPI